MTRLGFIGFGRMGMTHFSILRSHPDVQIAGIAESSGVMKSLVGKHLKVPTVASYEELLAGGGVDAVVVSTPNDSHAPIVEECVGRGIHAFVEKPFTMDLEAGRRALARLDGRPIVNQVGYVNRFNEVFQEVRRLVRGGLLGELVSFRSEMYSKTVLRDSKGSWRGNPKSGGGVLYDLGSHTIDLVVYLLGAPAKVGGSAMQRIYSSEVEDLVSSTFFYDSGLAGTIRVNWCDEAYRKPANLVEVAGTRGKLLANRYGFKVYLREADEGFGFGQGWSARSVTDLAQGVRLYVRGNEFTRQLDHFIDCIEGRCGENLSPFADAHVTDWLMAEIRRDAGPAVGLAAGQGARTWFKKLVGRA